MLHRVRGETVFLFRKKENFQHCDKNDIKVESRGKHIYPAAHHRGSARYFPLAERPSEGVFFTDSHGCGLKKTCRAWRNISLRYVSDDFLHQSPARCLTGFNQELHGWTQASFKKSVFAESVLNSIRCAIWFPQLNCCWSFIHAQQTVTFPIARAVTGTIFRRDKCVSSSDGRRPEALKQGERMNVSSWDAG